MTQQVFCTDFGDILLPEAPPKKKKRRKKKWRAYEQYVMTVAEHVWRQGKWPTDLVLIPFSEWVKGREL